MAKTSERMLLDVADHVLSLAKKHGAQSADLIASRSTDFEVKVADGAINTLTQAVSKGMGLRIFVDGRMGFCTTSDFNDAALDSAVQRAVQLAREAASDPFNGLVELEPGLIVAGDELQLYDPAVTQISTDEKIRWAHALEEAARASDPRVTKFRDSGVASGEAHMVMATSSGATRAIRSTGISLWCNPIAEADGQLQTEVWYDTRTHVADLEKPELVGRTAGLRAARMLGARPVKTQRAHIIFEPSMTAGFLGGMLGAIDGDAVYKKSSFLADKLGKQIGVAGLNVIDDPLRPRGAGSSPFDGEGLPTYAKKIVDQGVLTTFLYDSYTARKAGVKPTASARRGYSSPPHAGTFNFIVQPGTMERDAIYRGVDKALVVTRGLGRGVSSVSGEYSRGANGLWIENGEVVHAVQEVTIAGDFLTMLGNIDGIGSDLQMRGSSGAPTLRIADVTISGT